MRLVVVSNRVTQVSKTRPAAGGLAVGVHAALAEHGGIWFGWSGDVAEEPKLKRHRQGDVTYVLTDLTSEEKAGFYSGFSNRTLWPLFHYRLDLASFSHEWYQVYRRVNQRFARELAPQLQPDDIIWIQDYHLIPMATELRRLGVTNRIGFFLHIPYPAAQIMVVLPWHRQLAADFCAYDVVGFQTPTDLQQFKDYVARELSGDVDAATTIRALGRRLQAIACPIGIDVDEMQALAAAVEARSHVERMRSALRRSALVVGVDRLDYSKGIPERLRAFETLLRDYPEHHGQVSFLQISAPSREEVPEYVLLRNEVEQLAGRITGQYGEPDWLPLRYINRTHPRRALAGYFRYARVGFVTPLRDGLNLVAQEYVAAQIEDNPGVLVLSRFAGASAALEAAGALIVNPYDVHDTAGALNRALVMSADERRDRHRGVLATIRHNDITAWRKRFLSYLDSGPIDGGG
ncbi:trehalose 6-phosphate synthase [Arboricoccus pini]|uniref:Trehalose 6-phosphate synthase n=1 Tax=Arboricoccus pini TaxID=1963835 RepID=A0A212QN59_9PROT|nr:trehalose-6-phosphate synthase [Arboricoccus pini]SNB60785.1 trehalose 6-phosphate synthase [Arboricoccus pini]